MEIFKNYILSIFEVLSMSVISGMVSTALNTIKLSLEILGIPQSHCFRKHYIILAEITHTLESDS